MLVTNTLPGETFRTYSCPNSYDNQLTVFNEGTQAVLGYNDDNGPQCTGTSASLDFTSNTNGSVRILNNLYFCTTNATCGNVYVRVTKDCGIAAETNPLFAAASACSNGSVRLGAGAYYDIPVTAGIYYNFTWANGGANNSGFCAYPLNGNAGNFSSDQTAWYSGTTTSLRVSAGRVSNTWAGTSATMTYRHTQPASAAGADQNVCGSGTTLTGTPTYGTGSWSFVSGSGAVTSGGVVTGVAANSSGTFRYTVANNGCSATDDAVVFNRTPVTPTTSGAGTFCGSTTIGSSGGAGGTLYYQGTNAAGISTGDNATSKVVSSSGTYYWRSYNATYNCWSNAAGVTVTINPFPIPGTTISESSGVTPNDGIICTGASVSISGTGGTSYAWSSPPGGTANPVSVSPTGTTTYTVTVTDANNCSASTTRTITVNGLPAVTITATENSGVASNDNISCSGVNVTLTGGGANTYSWGAPILSSGNPKVVAPTGTTTYTVTGTDANGCIGNASRTITVHPNPALAVTKDECMSVIASVGHEYILLNASGGTGVYVFSSLTGDIFAGAGGNSSEKVWRQLTDNSTHNYQIADGNNCVATASSLATNGKPTALVMEGTSGNLASTCYDRAYNEWVTFRNASNEAILSIDDNGQDLGLVTASIYKDGSIQSITNSNNADGCVGYPQAVFARHYVVNSTTAPTSNVGIRIYFTDAELAQYSAATLANDVVGDECTNNDNALNINELYVTKYSGANEDGIYTNNDPNGLYRVYGTDNAQPLSPDGPLTKTIDGFSIDFSAPAGKHSIELLVSEFSEFWISGSVHARPLPVTMTYFDADAIKNSYIHLRWGTEVEIDNSGFEVQRSTDAEHWSQIGWVNGHNNSTVTRDYIFDDKNALPNVVYYYRLMQVDFDGDVDYTDPVSAKIFGQGVVSVNVYPNPAINSATIAITSAFEESATITITNILGSIQYQEEVVLSKTNSTKVKLDTDQFANGFYAVAVTAGHSYYTTKFQVNKP